MLPGFRLGHRRLHELGDGVRRGAAEGGPDSQHPRRGGGPGPLQGGQEEAGGDAVGQCQRRGIGQ